MHHWGRPRSTSSRLERHRPAGPATAIRWRQNCDTLRGFGSGHTSSRGARVSQTTPISAARPTTVAPAIVPRDGPQIRIQRPDPLPLPVGKALERRHRPRRADPCPRGAPTTASGSVTPHMSTSLANECRSCRPTSGGPSARCPPDADRGEFLWPHCHVARRSSGLHGHYRQW
jgi:hypothetical protein